MKNIAVTWIALLALACIVPGCVRHSQPASDANAPSTQPAASELQQTGVFPPEYYIDIIPPGTERRCLVVVGQYMRRIASREGYTLVEVDGRAEWALIDGCQPGTRAVMTNLRWRLIVARVELEQRRHQEELRRRAAERLFE